MNFTQTVLVTCFFPWGCFVWNGFPWYRGSDRVEKCYNQANSLHHLLIPPLACRYVVCHSEKNTWPPSSFTSSFIAGNFSGLHASSIQLILCNTIHVFTALPFSVFPYKWCNVGLNWHFCLDIVSLRKRYVLCSFVQLA